MQEKNLGEIWSFNYMLTAANPSTVEKSQLSWEKVFETAQ